MTNDVFDYVQCVCLRVCLCLVTFLETLRVSINLTSSRHPNNTSVLIYVIYDYHHHTVEF